MAQHGRPQTPPPQQQLLTLCIKPTAPADGQSLCECKLHSAVATNQHTNQPINQPTKQLTEPPGLPRDQLTWWDELVGRAFLKPFKLDAKKSFFTSLGTRGKVHSRIGELMKGKLPVYLGGREGR